MTPETDPAACTDDGPAQVETTSAPITSEPLPRGVWSHDIDALCRAIDAEERAHRPPKIAEKK